MIFDENLRNLLMNFWRTFDDVSMNFKKFIELMNFLNFSYGVDELSMN